jgi:hypothetical protein
MGNGLFSENTALDYLSAGFNSFANNIYNVITGREKFGQHKNWGGGSSSWLTTFMRETTEGVNYKEWDAYNARIVKARYDGVQRQKAGSAQPAYENPDKVTQVYNWSTDSSGGLTKTKNPSSPLVSQEEKKSKSWIETPSTVAPVEKRKIPVEEQSKSLLWD